MVLLYTWSPDPTAPVKGYAPDLGHSSLQVGDAYASFWPQDDSLVGTIVSLIKHRVARQPASYAEEIERENGFMQRPADFTDGLVGLDEANILARWEELRNAKFDPNSYNCSHVTRDLLEAGLSPTLRPRLPELCRKREHVPLTDCTPLGLRSAILELLADADPHPA